MAAAIASGSQGWKGNCAALVKPATATRTATTAVNPGRSVHTSEASACESDVVPVATTISTTANSRVSPPKKVMNSVRADADSAPEPDRAISRKEAREVISQHANSRTRSSARTSPTMPRAKTVIHR